MLSPPAPLLPRVPPGRQLRVTDISPLELARQLTILEFGYFQKIKPVECLNKAWNRDDGEKRAPNVRSVIHTANVLSGWVVISVLSQRDVKFRAGVMKYFIQAALVRPSFQSEVLVRVESTFFTDGCKGTTESEQLFFYGSDSGWSELRPGHPSEADEGDARSEDFGVEGGSRFHLGFDEKFLKL